MKASSRPPSYKEKSNKNKAALKKNTAQMRVAREELKTTKKGWKKAW